MILVFCLPNCALLEGLLVVLQQHQNTNQRNRVVTVLKMSLKNNKMAAIYRIGSQNLLVGLSSSFEVSVLLIGIGEKTPPLHAVRILKYYQLQIESGNSSSLSILEIHVMNYQNVEQKYTWVVSNCSLLMALM